MKKAFNYIKHFLTWDKKNPELRKYDILIIFLVVFLIGYTTVTFLNIYGKVDNKKEVIEEVVYDTIIQSNSIRHINTITNQALIVETKTIREYSVGQVVGVKHMGIIGIISEKTLGLSGYRYEVMYRDGSGVIQKIEIAPWLLYHPHKEQLNPYYLLN